MKPVLEGSLFASPTIVVPLSEIASAAVLCAAPGRPGSACIEPSRQKPLGPAEASASPTMIEPVVVAPCAMPASPPPGRSPRSPIPVPPPAQRAALTWGEPNSGTSSPEPTTTRPLPEMPSPVAAPAHRVHANTSRNVAAPLVFHRMARPALLLLVPVPAIREPSSETPLARLGEAPRPWSPPAAVQRTASVPPLPSAWPTTVPASFETAVATLPTAPPGRSPSPKKAGSFCPAAATGRTSDTHSVARREPLTASDLLD